ncbi:hypothetical protein PS647_04157 [Pseudomonas fluorescens]|uniref:hypothetical protein n=1 Tax=Pseudomonas fluorescens TaxID=294 RepID=UPI00124305E5|nr:hypothetical protein [Pseudomonas fluorescens]VVN17084.1 hypothetical protein PS647_04157 [Pseudomonas fluorescens]
MQMLRDSKSIEESARSYPDPELRELLAAHVKRLNEYEGCGLSEMVNFIVFEECDTVENLDASLGFPVMANRFDGCRYGEPSFSPSWEVIEEHINWFELVYVLSDDGFGVVVFVPKHADPELLIMLQQYAHQ